MAIEKDIPARPVFIVGIVSVILVFVVIVLLSALFLHMQEREVYNKAQSQAPGELIRLRADQLRSLEEYRWVDREKGLVAIPIEQAMELLVHRADEGDDSGRGR